MTYSKMPIINKQERRDSLEPWIKLLVLKAFLWKAVIQPNGTTFGDGSIIQPMSYRVPKKEVAAFLRKFIPLKQTTCDQCLLERHPILPGEQRDQPEKTDEVRMIQHLTKNSNRCLKEYSSDHNERRHSISKLHALVTDETNIDRAYLSSLETTKHLQPAVKEDWINYPQIKLMHFGSTFQLWSQGEIDVALRLKELLGWPYEFEPHSERKLWFLPHPMTGRLIPGEIAIIKEMSLRDMTSRMTKPIGDSGKSAKQIKPWPPAYHETRSDQDLYELLSNKPWRDRKQTDNMVNADRLVTWGHSKYTKAVPGFAARYRYSPVLFRDPTETTGPEQIHKTVQKIVFDCNRIIFQRHQPVRNSNHRSNQIWDELKTSLEAFKASLKNFKPTGCYELEDYEFGHFFDMHVLPDMCLCAESTHFVRTALYHCALHLTRKRETPSNPQQFSPPNAPNGIYCADCDDYIKEIHLEDIGALNNYLLEKEIHLPEEDSRTEKFLDERSENIKFCDW